MNTACWGAGVTYVRDGHFSSYTLSSTASSVVAVPIKNLGSVAIRVNTSTTGTIIFEGTYDGYNWITLPHVWSVAAPGGVDALVTAAVTPTAGNSYVANVGGLREFRIRTATALGANAIINVVGYRDAAAFRSIGEQATVGNVAHDGIDSGAPIKIGSKAVAHGTNPTAVAAGDRTDLFANRAGVQFVIGGHPNAVTASVRIAAATGAQTDAAISPGTISAGTKIVVTRITVTCSNANTVNVAVKLGFGASTIPADSTTGAVGVLADHEGVPPGGGFTIGDGSGILGIGGDGEELRLTCDVPTGGHIIVSYTYYTIES
jgi:hypothetical protein